MMPQWSLRYGAYEEEEDWDLSTLGVINSQLKMYIGRLPGGPGDLTLAELQEMATRQQQQMEAQQQVLVAKEQRLKYLKQQEARHAQLASESERLRKIRERVESQELKLKKLRALRGQAEQYRNNNGQLNSELDAVRAVFNEKEKELAMAVARVDQLTRQLNDLGNGKVNNGLAGQKQAAAALELEKLRKELLLRNKLNEQQTNNIVAKEKVLHQKREDMKSMDNRILELQQRLKKRKLQENENSQAYRQAANTQAYRQAVNTKQNKKENIHIDQVNAGNTIRTGHPYIQYGPADVAKDDSYSQSGHFVKQDPKYQTLPAGVRLGHPNAEVKGSNHPHQNVNENRDGHGDYTLPVVLPIRHHQNKPADNHNTNNLQKQQQQPSHVHHRQPHQQPELITPSHNKQQKFNNNDFSKPNQNFNNLAPSPSQQQQHHHQPPPQQQHHHHHQPPSQQQQQHQHHQPPPQPVPTQGHTHKNIVTDQSNKPNPPATTHRAFSGANTPRNLSSLSSSSATVAPRDLETRQNTDRVEGLPPSSLHPVISIHEEERQAGSGQSSPASSEGSSNSSGGIRIKQDQTNVNESSIGSVSAMIERLNQGNNKTNPPNDTANVPDSSHLSSTPHHVQTSGQNGHSKSAVEGVSTFLATKKQTPPHPSSRQAVNPGPSNISNLSSSNHQQDGNSPHTGSELKPSNQLANQTANNNNTSSTLPPSCQQGPHPQLNLKPAPTYRYASKNQIANTYMGRLGGAAMEKYQHNLNKLYTNLEVQDSKPVSGVGRDTSQVIAGATTPSQEGESQTFGAVSPHDYPDIASDKGSYKLNTPKQVRRRHSDGESDDVNKALQDRQEQETKEQQQAGETSKTPNVQDKPVSDKSTALENEKNQKAKVNWTPKGSEPSSESQKSSVSSTTTTHSSQPGSKPSSDPSTNKPSKVESIVRKTKSNLKNKNEKRRSNNRVSFDPLALLLDGSLEGELDLVIKVAVQVEDVSTPNDEGITALHNAICAGHYEIVKFLIEFGCDVNSPDSDGWTPLHCAASCNNLPMVRFLVEHGACVFATTISDQETAADKCEEDEDGYDGCSDYLYSIQEKLGIINAGDVYAVFDYTANKSDELGFVINDKLTVLRKGDETEKEWWWAQLDGQEGYIPRNLLGLYPRVLQQPSEVSEC